MKRSHAVIALAIVAALVVALPATGAAPNPLKVAKKALKIGKKADKRARKAARTANRALKTGRAAGTQAGVATRTADQALETGRAADTRARQALGVLAGSVPNATRAQSAGVADSLQGMRIARFNTRVAPSATATPQTAARAAAQRVPLLSEGPITVYGKCYAVNTDPANPSVEGEIYVETSAAGAVFAGDEGDSGSGLLGPATPEEDRDLLRTSSQAGVGNPGTLNTSGASAGPFYVIAPGVAIHGQLAIATKVGSPPAGDGVLGAGNACIFTGIANAS
ncbi:MAG TPA: hypothetical protein VHF88_04020 [Thermoleophilaceae bacterium]|nr:hypothetical protein [Thermoleophilaceae bacterium]